MSKHNKKRNVGLIHEQLVRHASEMTVERKLDEANKAINLLVRYFSPNSELLREFKLFGTLVETRVQNKETARRIIRESKRLSKTHNSEKLNVEKSKLISEINKTLNRDDFFNQKINDYKLFATIQMLINEWRGDNNLNAAELVDYEQKIEDHLLSDENIDEELRIEENANPLILKLMLEKFNKKYSNTLNKHQIGLLENMLLRKDDILMEKMSELKSQTVVSLKEFMHKNDNNILENKYDIILNKIDSFVPSITYDAMGKALVLSKLLEEIASE